MEEDYIPYFEDDILIKRSKNIKPLIIKPNLNLEMLLFSIYGKHITKNYEFWFAKIENLDDPSPFKYYAEKEELVEINPNPITKFTATHYFKDQAKGIHFLPTPREVLSQIPEEYLERTIGYILHRTGHGYNNKVTVHKSQVFLFEKINN